ncbi:YbaB/EbfC family nucleoid-associated protein [Kibdelosporangium lantanae]
MSQSDLSGIGEVVRDPEAVKERMEQWAQGFAAKAQRYQAAQAATEQVRLSASSPDGSVQVTVRADGTVTDLRFTEKIRAMPLAEISAKILTTMRSAQSGIANRVGEVVAEQLGDEDLETRTVMLGELRDRFPEVDEEIPPPEPESDKWDYPETEAPRAEAPPPPPPPKAPPKAAPPRRPQQNDVDDDFDPWSE